MSEQEIRNRIEEIAQAEDNVDTTELTAEEVAQDAEVNDTADTATQEDDLDTVEENADPEGAKAYDPNYKFKVYDKEHEFDEFVRDFVNKENEEQFRDLFTRAYGLEGVKSKLEKTREDLTEYQTKYNNVESGISQLQQMIDDKDYSSFFEALNVEDDMVFQYALEKLKYKELEPSERTQLDQQKQLQRQNQLLEQENKQLALQAEEDKIDQQTSELDFIVGSIQNKPIVDNFNSKYGKGAFEDEVIKEGLFYFNKNGQDISIDQAVQTVINRYGANNTGSVEAAPTVNPNVPVQKRRIVQNNNTLPNTGSGGSDTPVEKQINSIEDIERLSNEYARNSRGK